MNPTTKKVWTVIAVLLNSLTAYTYDFEVDGICYDITSMTELTVSASSLSESVEESLTIPSFVHFQGKNLIVKNIGASFAENNDRISNIVVGDSILTIGPRAFYNCPQIVSVTLMGVNSIGSESFKQCSKLSKIEFPENLLSIGDGAFEKCEALQKLNIPEQTNQIGANAFRECLLLDNVSLKNVTQINNNTFFGCLSLKNIDLPENLTFIGSYAFSGTAIETFIIPDSVTEVGESILSDCQSLKSLTIGNGVSTLSSNPIPNCPNIYELIFIDSNTPLNIGFGDNLIKSGYYMRGEYGFNYFYIYYGGFQNLSIKKLYLGRIVCPISYTPSFEYDIFINPFMGNKYLKEIVIGKTVKNLPAQVVDIKDYRGLDVYRNCFGYFEGCDSLQNVQILGNLEEISDRMFYGSNIEHISTPQSISSIGSYAFYNCPSLKEISIGKNCKKIGVGAFSKDDALTTLNLFCINPPEYSTGFENSEYINMNINIPPNTIDKYKESQPWCNFWNMQEDENLLTEFTIEPFKFEIINNENVELVGFTDLELERIDIPSSFSYNNKNYVVTKLSFEGSSLKNCAEFIIPNTINSLPASIFKDCISLTNIDLGRIEEIPSNCFYNCTSLSELTIPESCRSIGDNAFNGCSSLKMITIPVGCISVGNDVFNGCTQLTSLCFEKSNTPIKLGSKTHVNLSSTITPFPNPTDVDQRRTGFRNGYYDGLFYGLPLERIVINRDIELPKYYERSTGSSTSNYTYVYNDIVYNPPFYGLSDLKYVEIGENVSAICKNQIEAVFNAVNTTLEYKNFGNCDNIKVVVSNNPSAPIGGSFSNEAYNKATLYLPNGGEASYRNDEYWKNFINIRESSFIPTESIFLDSDSIQLELGEMFTITATILPEDATDNVITWSSSDEKIAIVDDQGIVFALSIGEATITATCGEESASCVITVTPILAETLTISPESWTGEEGESFIIETTLLPENTSDKTLKFESDDESIAVVDQNGKVSVLKEGTCIITVSTMDGSDLTAQCFITGLTGIESIFSDPDVIMDIYNQQGVLLKSKCSLEDLKQLQPAIYIIRTDTNAKKFIITHK